MKFDLSCRMPLFKIGQAVMVCAANQDIWLEVAETIKNNPEASIVKVIGMDFSVVSSKWVINNITANNHKLGKVYDIHCECDDDGSPKFGRNGYCCFNGWYSVMIGGKLYSIPEESLEAFSRTPEQLRWLKEVK